MTRRRSGLVLVMVLAVTAVLAGCRDGGSDDPPPDTALTTPTLPSPTLSPNTTLVSALPRLLRIVDGYHQFEVSPQQYDLIGKRWYQVLKRDGLWDQGARFGANADRSKNYYFVLIDPGLSQLSARQILNRLLGVY